MADDLFQQLTHIGSALGPIGVMITGFLSRTVNAIRADMTAAKTAAADAVRLATDAVKVAGEAKTYAQGQGSPQNSGEFRKVVTDFDDLRRGLHLEVSTLKNSLDERFAQASRELQAMARQLVEEAVRRFDHDMERFVRGSRPEGLENDALLVEVRSRMEHEREQRKTLQETLTGHMRDGVERWLKMERFIGSIESTVDTWKRERTTLEEKIESLHRELRDMRSRPR